MIIDTHSHITDELLSPIQDQIIANMKKDNLEKIVTVGCDKESCIDSENIAENNENIYAIVGIHPEYAEEYNQEIENFLRKIAKGPKIIAIGEIGLDYHRDYDKVAQKKAFESQIRLANELNLPIVIHTRDAVSDTIEILKNNAKILNNGIIIHCFSESLESYKIFEKMGCYISIGGILTFKDAKKSIEVIKYADINKILLETDCPYLTPEPFRSKQLNQPKFANLVCQKIAEIKNLTLKQVEDATTQNAYRFFKKLK